jgi:DNA helicase IV
VPTTESFFSLSDQQRAKAAPELIRDDERHLAAVASRLQRLVADLTAQLTAALAAPGRHGQQAVERDLDVRRLDARVRLLERYGVDLCLGRMVPVDGAPLYLGRIGLAGDDGERLLVDWRSPAAEPFFAATRAHSRGLVSRRRYRWSRGRVIDYSDEVFTDDLVPSAALDEESAFLASLGASRSERMRDVLVTIQADQDAIIRASARQPLVVEGGPGTGKTVVALHRAAYLLYADPRVGDHRGGVLVIGPTPGYVSYVSDILPGLGEDGVETCTLADLVPESAVAVPDDDPRAAECASTLVLVRALERAIRAAERPPADVTVIETEWADLPVTPDDWADLIASLDDDLPHNEARDALADRVVDLVAERLGGRVPARVLEPMIRPSLDAALEDVWPRLDAEELVAQLRSDADVLRRFAPELSGEEVALLVRADGRRWTTTDVPLLDAARHLIGDGETRERHRRRRDERARQREQIDRVVANLLDADDGEGLVTMFRVGDLQDALIDDATLEHAPRDPLAGPFAHVIVDEAQELTDAEWAMVVRRCPSRSITIVGDRAQARRGFSESWQERLDRVGIRRASVAALSVNYRTPGEVMALAEPVIRGVIPDAAVPTSARWSGRPVRRARPAAAASIVEAWLAEHAEGVVALIGRAPREVGDPSRVRSLTPAQAKGLEFDLVVLDRPSTWGDSVADSVDRYVAMTRATQELVVLDEPDIREFAISGASARAEAPEMAK